MANQIIKQPKTDQKWKAITSLIAGIISITPIIILFSRSFLPKKMFLFSFFSIIGIVFGVKGLRSTKKNIAIGGIIFSIIGLIGLIMLFRAWLGSVLG